MLGRIQANLQLNFVPKEEIYYFVLSRSTWLYLKPFFTAGYSHNDKWQLCNNFHSKVRKYATNLLNAINMSHISKYSHPSCRRQEATYRRPQECTNVRRKLNTKENQLVIWIRWENRFLPEKVI